MKPLSRRQFTFGLGASLLAAPFLDLLRGAPARAATDKVADRLILFFSPDGTIPRLWKPTGTETSFDFPAGSILEPLRPIKGDLTVIDGLNFVNATNHEGGMSAMLTGLGAASSETGGMSVDQFVASKIGQKSFKASLELGVIANAWGGSHQTRMCYKAPGQFIPPNDNPPDVYKTLFGDLTGDAAATARLLARRKSVLDLVKDDLASLRAQVGAIEAQKLDAHLDALRSLEIGMQSGGACTPPTAPAAGDPWRNDDFPALGKTQMDLLVAALSCGMTKVASLQWSHTVSETVFGWAGLSDGHHALSHAADGATKAVADFVTAERWYAQQFAYLVGRLKAIPDPSGKGSLLDTSLVVWCKEMGDSRLHVCTGVPFILAGKANGFLRPGRYLQYNGTPHNQLLVSLCQGMGLTNNTFGDPAAAKGPLPNLS